MSKPRKKYNPNKVKQIIQAKKLQAKQQQDKLLQPLYEFTMEYKLEDILQNLFSLSEKYGYEKGTVNLPSHIVLEAYEYRDLVVAINRNYLKTPEYWEISAQTVYFDEEANDVIAVPFYIELPSMRYLEISRPSDLKVNRGGGIKTRWRGLNTEIKENEKSENIPSSYKRLYTNIRMTAHAQFRDIIAYQQFHNFLASKDQLINKQVS